MSKPQQPEAAPRKPLSELGAMARIVKTLEAMTPDGRCRAIAYLNSLFPAAKAVQNGEVDPTSRTGG